MYQENITAQSNTEEPEKESLLRKCQSECLLFDKLYQNNITNFSDKELRVSPKSIPKTFKNEFKSIKRRNSNDVRNQIDNAEKPAKNNDKEFGKITLQHFDNNEILNIKSRLNSDSLNFEYDHNDTPINKSKDYTDYSNYDMDKQMLLNSDVSPVNFDISHATIFKKKFSPKFNFTEQVENNLKKDPQSFSMEIKKLEFKKKIDNNKKNVSPKSSIKKNLKLPSKSITYNFKKLHEVNESENKTNSKSSYVFQDSNNAQASKNTIIDCNVISKHDFENISVMSDINLDVHYYDGNSANEQSDLGNNFDRKIWTYNEKRRTNSTENQQRISKRKANKDFIKMVKYEYKKPINAFNRESSEFYALSPLLEISPILSNIYGHFSNENISPFSNCVSKYKLFSPDEKNSIRSYLNLRKCIGLDNILQKNMEQNITTTKNNSSRDVQKKIINNQLLASKDFLNKRFLNMTKNEQKNGKKPITKIKSFFSKPSDIEDKEKSPEICEKKFDSNLFIKSDKVINVSEDQGKNSKYTKTFNDKTETNNTEQNPIKDDLNLESCNKLQLFKYIMKTFAKDICEDIFDDSYQPRNKDYNNDVDEIISTNSQDGPMTDDFQSPDTVSKINKRTKRMVLSSRIKVSIGLENSRRIKRDRNTLKKKDKKSHNSQYPHFVKLQNVYEKQSSWSIKNRVSQISIGSNYLDPETNSTKSVILTENIIKELPLILKASVTKTHKRTWLINKKVECKLMDSFSILQVYIILNTFLG